MPENENCLVGFRCPACGSNSVFEIEAKALFRVEDDGAECVGDVEWDDDSFCRCAGCKHIGKVKDFTVSAK